MSQGKQSHLKWAILLGITPLLCGCSSAFKRDVTDCFRAKVGVGVGLYAEAEVTSLIQPAVGFGDGSITRMSTVGWDPRLGQPAGMLRTAAFPTLLLGFPFYESPWPESTPEEEFENRKRGLLGALILMGNHYVEGESCSLFGLHEQIPNPLLSQAPSLQQLTPLQRRSRDSWIAISGTLVLLNVDLGVNPLEILDMLGSLLGLDLLSDDERLNGEMITVP